MAGLGELFNHYLALNGYSAIRTDEDDASPYMYYQYMDRFGNWYIMRRESVAPNQAEYKWARGNSSVDDAWSNRSGLTFDFPNMSFKDI